MNNITFRRLAHALAGWAGATLASLANRQNIVLATGIGATAALSLPLLIQLAQDRRADPSQPSQLLAAYQGNGAIGLACFAAVAAGYIYWMLQLLGGEAEQDGARRLARWSDATFLLALAAVIAALGLWNIGVLTQ